ncbi:MAG: bacillithiol biosynthesis deacetylase BshB1, partial [Ignavibacteria bacterium]|nr:bacillithiol biosynthesis deacetylase BshB1 [Ignavibacteria bacterium]
YDIPVSFIVDISGTFMKKMEAIKCYATQFYNPKGSSADEPETYISSKLFLKDIETRARFYGFKIGAEFGEPFYCYEALNIQTENLFNI